MERGRSTHQVPATRPQIALEGGFFLPETFFENLADNRLRRFDPQTTYMVLSCHVSQRMHKDTPAPVACIATALNRGHEG